MHSDAVLDDCVDFLERRGMLADATFMRNMSFESRLMTGDWAALSADISRSEQDLPDSLVAQNARALKSIQLLVDARTGRTEELEVEIEALAKLRSTLPSDPAPWQDAYDLVPTAAALHASGHVKEAAQTLSDWAGTPRPASTVEFAWMVAEAVRLALLCSGPELAERLRHRGDGLLPVQQIVMASVGSLLGEAHRRTRRRPVSQTPPPAGTISACHTRRHRPCSARGAAWRRLRERPRRQRPLPRHARSSLGSAPSPL